MNRGARCLDIALFLQAQWHDRLLSALASVTHDGGWSHMRKEPVVPTE